MRGTSFGDNYSSLHFNKFPSTQEPEVSSSCFQKCWLNTVKIKEISS